MTRRLRIRAWAAGTLLLAAVSACASAPPPQPPGLGISTSSPTTTSALPSAASQAVKALHGYFATMDAVRSNPSAPIQALASTATGTQLISESRLVSEERARGLRQTGSTRLVTVDVVSASPGSSSITIDACWDVHAADLVDRAGHSVLSANRVTVGWTRYFVSQEANGVRSTWRVSSSQDLKRRPCLS